MNKALIITGGYINFENLHIKRADFSLVLAADSGYSAAKKLGLVPDVVLGDFDSLGEKIKDNVCVVTVPAEKDDTDTMLACNVAIERGYSDIIIIGGTGGRADHFLANVFFLEALCDRGVRAILTDGENTLRILKNETVNISRSNGYFSVFALDDCTVTLSGCKYPLSEYRLKRTNPFAVSNEVIDNYAEITVNGKLVLCESQK